MFRFVVINSIDLIGTKRDSTLIYSFIYNRHIRLLLLFLWLYLTDIPTENQDFKNEFIIFFYFLNLIESLN